MENVKRFNSFAEFYPYYLSEHSNSTCRRLHFIGTTLVILILTLTIGRGAWMLLWALPLAGYSFAWVGHFFFEKNRPATFQHPSIACSAILSCTGTWSWGAFRSS